MVTREDVLSAFSVEPEPDATTLAQYQADHPEYADDLASLAAVLREPTIFHAGPLTDAEKKMIDSAWENHKAPGPQTNGGGE